MGLPYQSCHCIYRGEVQGFETYWMRHGLGEVREEPWQRRS